MSSISAGTTSTTGLVATSDTTGALVLKTGASATTAVTIDTSQNVGIGTSSPAYKLDVDGTLQLRANGAEGGELRLLNTGNASTGLTIDVATADVGRIYSTTNNFSLQLGQLGGTGGQITFYTTAAERMRIDNNGSVLVGATATVNSSKFYSLNTAGCAGVFYNSAASQQSIAALRIDKADNTSTTSQVFVQFTINAQATGSGQINANGAGAAAFGSYSDLRLKENIESLPSQLNNICALRPVEFDYKAGGHQIGFIAQEMQAIYPDSIGENSDGMLTIAGWSKTEARLVKAIQEQQTLIQSLTTRLTALEQK